MGGGVQSGRRETSQVLPLQGRSKFISHTTGSRGGGGTQKEFKPFKGVCV